MYEVKSRTRKINGVDVETWEREIIDANILSVEVGTNGYQGGDTGHGCRTYIRISDEGSTDIDARVIENHYGDTTGIEVTTAEMQSFPPSSKHSNLSQRF